MKRDCEHFVVVTIVNKGWASEVEAIAEANGAEGGTIILGRGSSLRHTQSIMGIPLQKEKDLVINVVDEGYQEQIMEALVNELDLNEPGTGMTFSIKLDNLRGAFGKPSEEAMENFKTDRPRTHEEPES